MSAEVLSVSEAIKARHSIRLFSGPLSEERRALVNKLIDEASTIEAPFGTSATIGDHAPGIGIMVINEEAGWLVGKLPKGSETDAKHVYDVAFRLHYFVLKMTQHRFGCVWITGTYRQAVAEETFPGFTVPGGIAYGEDPQRIRLRDRFMKFMAGSAKRKPLDSMFFDGDNNRPFTDENAGTMLELLQAVQSAPSAMNEQSWRLLVVGNVLHLYNAVERNMAWFDAGIALATMKMLIEDKGKKLTITTVEDAPTCPLGGSYVATCTIT